MFDSPMEHCPVCGQMVALDQSRSECRRTHACASEVECPLRKYFTDSETVPETPKKIPPGA